MEPQNKSESSEPDPIIHGTEEQIEHYQEEIFGKDECSHRRMTAGQGAMTVVTMTAGIIAWIVIVFAVVLLGAILIRKC
jgi:hypothetical protein